VLHTERLNLQFKGDRNYVHGTDIFNQALAWLKLHRGNVQSIDFSFHRITSCQLCVAIGVPPKGIDPVAICSFTAHGAREKLYVFETESKVIERYQYPEEEIARQLQIDSAARRCVLRGGFARSDIELWVTMAKALHYEVFPLTSKKWWFVRCRYPQYESYAKSLERTLCIVSNFGDKLTRSEIFLNNQIAGEIYFAAS
jgi:hypothetical protein